MPPNDPAAPPPAETFNTRFMRRLPGQPSFGTRLFSNSQLWLARDFLLHVRNPPYWQEVRQFAYRDIQALEICGSSRWLVYNLVLGLPLLILAIVAIAEKDSDTRLGLLIAAAFFLVPMIVNIVRGPTCRCILQTALGSQELPSLSRRRSARRALDMLAERVAAAQREG